MTSILVRTLTLALLCLACGAGRRHDEAARSPSSAGAQAASARLPPRILGTTVDARTGQPLARVRLTFGEGEEVLSDARGRFEIEDLEAGASGDLLARTDDGRSGRNRIQPLAGGPLEVVVYVR
jgi:hypothetical protein